METINGEVRYYRGRGQMMNAQQMIIERTVLLDPLIGR